MYGGRRGEVVDVDESNPAEALYTVEYEQDGTRRTAQVRGSELRVAEAEDVVGRSLTEEEALGVLGLMEANAEPMPEVELTPQTWHDAFGDNGEVSTPMGMVKMGANQLAKLFEKGRSGQFGMIRPTLEDPQVVIEVPSEATDGTTERPTSLLFVKTFIGKNGEKVYYFKSVTVKRDGMEVSVSSHYDRAGRIKDAMKKGKLLYRFDGGAQTEQRPADVSVTASPDITQGNISDGKGSDFAEEEQENGAESSESGENSENGGSNDAAGRDAAEGSVLGRIPRRKVGQAEVPDWTAVEPVVAAEGLEERYGERAEEYAGVQLTAARERLEQARKPFKPRRKGMAEAELDLAFGRHEAEARDAESAAAKWEAIAGALRERTAARAAAADAAEGERVRALAAANAAAASAAGLENVPEWTADVPGDARGRGFRRVDGRRVERRESLGGIEGRDVEVNFGKGRTVGGKVVVVEAESVEPSHLQGRLNAGHFLPEAQPKDRADGGVSATEAADIARGIRPKQITEPGVTAYVGAPTVNGRGEVIQGNNRVDALRLMWERYPEQAAVYKAYLMEHAGEFGLKASDIEGMAHPVVVVRVDVGDAEAIELGQYTNDNVESGGSVSIDPVNLIGTLGERMNTFVRLLLNSGEEDATLSQLISENGLEVYKWLSSNGYITATQYRTALNGRGGITDDARGRLRDVLYESVFRGGAPMLRGAFGTLPVAAQNAILATAFRDGRSVAEERLLHEIQQSIIAYSLMRTSAQMQSARTPEQAMKAMLEWCRQSVFDDVSGEMVLPAERYSGFALHMAALYHRCSQRTIRKVYDDIFDFVQGTVQPSLFEGAPSGPMGLAEAIGRVLDIEYKPGNTRNNGTIRGNDVGVGSEVSQGGERGGGAAADGGEQGASGAGASDGGSGAAEDGGGRGRGGGVPSADEGQGGLQAEEAGEVSYRLSDEVDENGRQFVLNSEGGIEFGRIEAATGLTEAPILLSEGVITDPKTKESYGLVHIEARHGAQIRSNGYGSIVEFIESVAKNWTVIREGKDRNGNPTYRLIAIDKHNNTLMVELSGDGTYWNINTAGIFKNSYGKNKREIYSRHTTANQSTETDGASQGTEQSGTAEPSRMNAPISGGKGSESSESEQILGQESSESSENSENSENSEVVEDGQTAQGAVEGASSEVNTEPTEAQKEAGNYKKGHVTIGEFDITIENPAGSTRKGVDAGGNEWETTMANAYGYIRGTEGVDGDHIDVFLARDMDAWNGRKVFVVDQTNTDGSFDEHKVMLGFNDKDEAMAAYLANYDATWAQTHPGLRISETNVEDFNKWIDSSHRKTKPFAEYSTVSKVTDNAPTESAEQSTDSKVKVAGYEAAKAREAEALHRWGEAMEAYRNAGLQWCEKEGIDPNKKYSKEERDAILVRFNATDEGKELLRRREEARAAHIKAGREVGIWTVAVAHKNVSFNDIKEKWERDERESGNAPGDDGLSEPTPIGKGPLGNIFNQFKGKVKEAVNFLLNNREGDLIGVFSRNGFGDIDFVWGNKGGGFDHIIDKHVGDGKSFASPEEAAEAIDNIIKNGSIDFENGDKVVFRMGDKLVTVRKNFRVKGKKIADKNWVLTAYDEKAADGDISAIAAVNEAQAAQGTAKSEGEDSAKSSATQASGDKSDKSDNSDNRIDGTGVNEERELTASDIEGMDAPEEVKVSAIAYVNGERSFINQLNYHILKQQYNATNISRKRAGDSQDEDGPQLGTTADASGAGAGGRGRRGGMPVDQREDGAAVAGTGHVSGQPDGTGDMAEPTGAPGHIGVAGRGTKSVRKNTGGVKSQRGGVRGGDGPSGRDNGRGQRNGQGVSGADAGGSGKAGASGADVGSTLPKDPRALLDDSLKELGDLLSGIARDPLGAGGKVLMVDPVTVAVKLGINAARIMAATAKVGYSLVYMGYRALQRWKGEMHSKVDGLYRDSFSDEEIDYIIEQAWEMPFTWEGRTLKLCEWATELDAGELRAAMRLTLEQKRKMQQDAEGIGVVTGDIANIRDTLPFLLPKQQEDVLLAERQFFDPSHSDYAHAGGKGYMFTNGTGTGKTYTGLGIAKRFIKRGQGRILIVTAQETKIKDWIRDAGNLGIEASMLADTKSKGSGVVVTQYANLRQNYALLEDEFDLVIYDESHKIQENQQGEATATDRMHHMVCGRDSRQVIMRGMMSSPLMQRLRGLEDEISMLQKILATPMDKLTTEQKRTLREHGGASGVEGRIKELSREVEGLQKRFEEEVDKALADPEQRRRAQEAVSRTKVVFLSATPFNTALSLDYAEGYIFHYGQEATETEKTTGSMSDTDRNALRNKFLMEKFGGTHTRDRSGAVRRLHEQDIRDVERANAEEVAFSDHLQNELNTMSGRNLESEWDYSRTFPQLESAQATIVNKAIQALTNGKYSPLKESFGYLFNYNNFTAFLETIKADLCVGRIREHISEGRKVVVFHRRKASAEPLRPPFAEGVKAAMKEAKLKALAASFAQEYSALLSWEQSLDLSFPQEKLVRAFATEGEKAKYAQDCEQWQRDCVKAQAAGKRLPKEPQLSCRAVAVFNGDETQASKDTGVQAFNTDGSGTDVLVVQISSGKEGISLHDTTGKHQRVMMSLALPQSPIEFIQAEGRIYRVGNASNAIFEYITLGVDYEISSFAMKINGRSQTSENLALGSSSRGLRESISRAVLSSRPIPVTSDMGHGGKELDSRAEQQSDDFDQAVKDYGEWREEASRGRVPNPIGYMMVKWAAPEAGETVLVPNAKDGTVARYVPGRSRLVALEAEQSFFAPLAARLGGGGRKMENKSFEDYARVNKADCVVIDTAHSAAEMRMGVSESSDGRDVVKALGHIEDSGRVVALVRSENLAEVENHVKIKPESNLTGVVMLGGSAFGGTPMSVVVIDTAHDAEVRKGFGSTVRVDLSDAADINSLLGRLRDVEMPARVVDEQSKMRRRVGRVLSGLNTNVLSKSKDYRTGKMIPDMRNTRDVLQLIFARGMGVIPAGDSKGVQRTFNIRYARIAGNDYGYIIGLAKQWEALEKELSWSEEQMYQEYDYYLSYNRERVASMYDLRRVLMGAIEAALGKTPMQIRNMAQGKVENELPSGELSLEQFVEAFHSLNSGDATLESLAERVFATASKIPGLRFSVRSGAVFSGHNVMAHYVPSRNIIEINADRFNDLRITDGFKASTIVHETIHAVTVWAIETYRSNPGALTAEQRQACADIMDVYKHINTDDFRTRLQKAYKEHDNASYGLTNEEEMIAELANPAFRALLKATRLWRQLVNGIKRLLNIDVKSMIGEAHTKEDSQTDALTVLDNALETLLNSFDPALYRAYTSAPGLYGNLFENRLDGGNSVEKEQEKWAESANFAREYRTEDGKRVYYRNENESAYTLPGGDGTGGVGESVGRQRTATPVQRKNGALLSRAGDGLNAASGEYCAIERVFRESTYMDFTSGQKVKSVADVAFIFEELENASVENAFVVMTKRGVPTVLHLSIGSFTATMVNVVPVKLACERIKPDKVYFVHNHPSGALICSAQDVDSLRKMEEAIGVPVEGVIINLRSGKYGTFTSAGSWSSEERSKGGRPTDQRRLRLYAFDRYVFNPEYEPSSAMRSSQDVAEFLSSHRLGDRSKVSILVANRQNQIVANVHTTHTAIDSSELADDIVRAIGNFGGMSAFVYGDFESNGEESGYNKLAAEVRKRSGREFKLMDVVHIAGNHTWSAMDNGMIGEPESDYGIEEDGVEGPHNKKSPLEARQDLTTSSSRPTDAAKLQQISENLAALSERYKGKRDKKGVFTDLAQSIGATKANGESASDYATLRLANGTNVEIRISNHNANAGTFAHRGETANNISIVIKSYRTPNTFRPHPEVELTEYVYTTEAIREDGNLLSQVADSLRKMIGTGEYVDLSGKAIVNRSPAEDGVRFRGREADNSDNSDNSDISDVEVMAAHARALGRKLHVRVRVVQDVDEITDSDGLRRQAKQGAKGWYDTGTGEVVVVVPNHSDVGDVTATVLHEVIGHKGLRELVGAENFDGLMDELYAGASDEVRRSIHALMSRHGWDVRLATEEYVASLAERGFEDMNESEQGFWGRVRSAVMRLLERVLGGSAVMRGAQITDNEIRWLLWEAYRKATDGTLFGEARSASKRWDLRVGRWRDVGLSGEVGASEPVGMLHGRDEIKEAVNYFQRGMPQPAETVVITGESDYREFLEALGFEEADVEAELEEYARVQASERHLTGGYSYEYKKIVIFAEEGITVKELEDTINHEEFHHAIDQRAELQEVVKELAPKLREIKPKRAARIDQFYSHKSESARDEEVVIYTIERALSQGNLETLLSKLDEEGKNQIIELANAIGYGQKEEKEFLGNHFMGSGGRPQRNTPGDGRGGRGAGTGSEETAGTDPGIRFRLGGNGAGVAETARQEYDRRVRAKTVRGRDGAIVEEGGRKLRSNKSGSWNEAYLDSMRSVRILQEAISRESRAPIEEFEDVWRSENAVTSANKAATEVFQRTLGKELLEAVSALAPTAKEYRSLTEYMKAKHGLERNAWMRTAASAEVAADKKLGAAGKQRKLAEIAQTDYAGLTGLTGHAEVGAAEAAATQLVEDYERGHDTGRLWAAVDAVRRSYLEKRVYGGLLSREGADELLGRYKNYVPLKGWDELTAQDYYWYGDGDSGGNGPGSSLRHAEGRVSESDDPIANLMSDYMHNINEVNRNRSNQRLLNLALNHPTSLLRVHPQWYRKGADGRWTVVYPSLPPGASAEQVERLMEQFDQDMEVLAKQGETLRLRPKGSLGFAGVDEQLGKHMVRVWRRGQQYNVIVQGDPRAAMAINGELNPDSGPETLAKKAAYEVKNFMGRAFTTWSPEFVVSNLCRDATFAMAAVSVKESGAYAGDYFTAASGLFYKGKMLELVRKWQRGTLDLSKEEERYFHEFITNGGETGFTQLYTVDNARKEIERAIRRLGGSGVGRVGAQVETAMASVGGAMEYLNRCAEDLTRFAVYMTSRRHGRGVTRSISDAKDITVNFNRKGSGARGAQLMNFAFVFFNAGVQAAANGGRLLLRHPGKSGAVVSLMVAAGMLVPMLFCWLDDEEEYFATPKWVRRNNIVIPWLRIVIPLPHELRPFWGIGECAFSVLRGKQDAEEAIQEGLEGFTSIIPLDFTGNGGNLWVSLTPTVLQPVVQAKENVDYFGKPIYRNNGFNADEPGWTKAYGNTHPFFVEASRWLYQSSVHEDEWGVERRGAMSSALDINPAVVQHLIEGYTGGLGKTLVGVARTLSMFWDEEARRVSNVPVLRRFYKPVDERARERWHKERLYEVCQEYEGLRDTYRSILHRPGRSQEENLNTVQEYLNSEDGRRMLELYDHYNQRQVLRRYLKDPRLSDERRQSYEDQLAADELWLVSRSGR